MGRLRKLPYPARREPVLDPQALADCVAHLDALRELAAESATSYRADLIGRLLLFLGVLTRAGTGPYGGDGAAEPAPPAVAEVIRLMESDLGHGWSLGELDEASFLIQGYLVRLFKASVGMPPMAYLMRLRAERAAMLLVQTDHPVSCIGHLVGRPDRNHFARRFRAHFGMSATSFRGNSVRRPGKWSVSPAQSIDGKGVPRPWEHARGRRRCRRYGLDRGPSGRDAPYPACKDDAP